MHARAQPLPGKFDGFKLIFTSCFIFGRPVQVKQRFRDDSIVEDLEQMGIRLAGMPETGEATIDSVSNADVSVCRCYDP